jgi:pimeloyl-ACP methyl ester carboxylesterase
LYERQLLELLEGLRLRDRRPAHIIGLSMGGVISIHFARQHPHWVRSLTLIAPAGFLLEIPTLARVARTPVIGDYFIHAFGHSLFMRGLHRNLYNQELFARYREQILPQMYIVGTKAALLSSVRHMPLSESQEIYRQVAATGLPMQIFWGREDRVIPLSIGQTMHAALPAAQFYAIPGAGHIVHWEQPQAIRKNLLQFLKVH